MPFKAKNNREAVVVCAIHVVKRPSKRSVLVDTNFLNIRIISYRDTATFQFVPQVAQVAYYTNIFATLLISTIYDLK